LEFTQTKNGLFWKGLGAKGLNFIFFSLKSKVHINILLNYWLLQCPTPINTFCNLHLLMTFFWSQLNCFWFYYFVPELTFTNGTALHNEVHGGGGCPYQYKWCQTIPKISFWQFLTGATLVGVGYPIAAVLLSTLYSKVIGPFPQV